MTLPSKQNALILLIAFFTMTLFSCKKDSTPADATGNSAIVTGSYGFDGAAGTVFYSSKAGIIQNTVAGITSFSISAIRDGGNESITIIGFQNITGPTTINFSSSLNNGGTTISKNYNMAADQTINYTTDNNGSAGALGGAQLKVVSYDGTNIEGTFYAVAYNNSGRVAFVEQGTFKGKVTR